MFQIIIVYIAVRYINNLKLLYQTIVKKSKSTECNYLVNVLLTQGNLLAA